MNENESVDRFVWLAAGLLVISFLGSIAAYYHGLMGPVSFGFVCGVFYMTVVGGALKVLKG